MLNIFILCSTRWEGREEVYSIFKVFKQTSQKDRTASGCGRGSGTPPPPQETFCVINEMLSLSPDYIVALRHIRRSCY